MPTEESDSSRSLWPVWARFLQRRGLDGIAVTLLESTGPWFTLGAQAIYLGQPFIGQTLPGDQLQALARLFENQNECKTFAAYLREAGSP